MGSKRGRITAVEQYMELKVVFHEETISCLLPQKDAVSVPGQCNAILADFSQKMTELPLGNGLATGIHLVVRVGGE